MKEVLGIEAQGRKEEEQVEPKSFEEVVYACLMNKDVSLESISALVDLQNA